MLVNYGKTFFSESLPELWLFLLGGLFIGVVMGFPNGLAGFDVRRMLERMQWSKLRARWTALPSALPRIELERVAFGPLGLRGLAAGRSRRLTAAEVERLRRSAEPRARQRR